MALLLQGICKGVVRTEAKTNKETGEIIDAAERVQVEVENVQPNGDVKFEIYTLKTEQGPALRKLLGKPVSIPVGMMIQNNKPALYGLKSAPAAPSH